MDISLFDYDLPEERIAQEPAEPRDASKLLLLDRARGTWEDARFSDLPRWLRAGDCLVVNESRVIPARLIGALEGDRRPVELLMLRPLEGGRWEVLVRPGKRCSVGARVTLAGGAARATVLERRALGARAVEIEAPWPVDELMERHGLPPLPPYIERHDAPKPEDWERYQTVYAAAPGAVAAPTAGLHFTPELFGSLRAQGVAIATLTLHVGPGTFLPIRVDDVEAHRMHAETYTLPQETADAIVGARARGGQVVAVGAQGELCTRGYSVMLGYWNNEEATRGAIDAAGWMHTGDLATMDDEGYINIVGRIKDMIIRGGENVYPREIEEFLYGHPKVQDVQVIGVPDIKFGEEVMAWVRLREGQTATEEEIREYCRGKIAHYKVPRYVKFVDGFPMTVTGNFHEIATFFDSLGRMRRIVNVTDIVLSEPKDVNGKVVLSAKFLATTFMFVEPSKAAPAKPGAKPAGGRT